MFDLGFDIGDQATKIFVRRNGCDGAPKELRLPPMSKLADLFEKAGKVLDMDMPQIAYFSNGVECTDVENLEDDEVVFISCGEPFKGSGAKQGGSCKMVGNYILHEKLGQGGFGAVMKGVHSETGEVAAIKFVPKSSFKQISDLQRVYQEIQALRALQHPHVIKILDVADNPENVCFIMEFCPGGELRDYVEKQGFLSEEDSRKFFKEISRAVHYVHQKKIIHRDLKLENILLDAQNRCKIVDFGLSDYVASNERTVTDAGTEAYLAPEVWNGSSGDADPYKIDVWGLGVILYALAHGRLPFNRPDVETCQKLVADNGPQYREELSKGFRRLDTMMLIPAPEKRASMDSISLDAWVTKNRFASWDDDDGDDEGDEAVSQAESFGRESSEAVVEARSTAASLLQPPRQHSFISEASDNGPEAPGRPTPTTRPGAARAAVAAAAAIIGRPGDRTAGRAAARGARGAEASGAGAGSTARRRAPSSGPGAASPTPPRSAVAQAGATVAGARRTGDRERGVGDRSERSGRY